MLLTYKSPWTKSLKNLLQWILTKSYTDYNRLPFRIFSAQSIENYGNPATRNQQCCLQWWYYRTNKWKAPVYSWQGARETERGWFEAEQTKMFFLQPSIEYFGHIIDKDRLHPTEKKVWRIMGCDNIPRPKSCIGSVAWDSARLASGEMETRSSPPTAPLHPWQWPGLTRKISCTHTKNLMNASTCTFKMTSQYYSTKNTTTGNNPF